MKVKLHGNITKNIGYNAKIEWELNPDFAIEIYN